MSSGSPDAEVSRALYLIYNRSRKFPASAKAFLEIIPLKTANRRRKGLFRTRRPEYALKNRYWLLSLIITLVFAVFQRMTGPTYPLNDTVVLDGGNVVSFRLPRSCTVAGRDCLIKIDTPEKIDGYISWRRYPSGGPWNETEMSYRDGPRTLGPETDDKRAGNKLEPVPGEPKVRAGCCRRCRPPPAGKLRRVFIKRKRLGIIRQARDRQVQEPFRR